MFAPDSGQARLGSGTGEIARHLVEPSAVGEDGNGAHVINLVRQARERWLKNTEVCDILINYRQYGFHVSQTSTVTPPGAPPRARRANPSPPPPPEPRRPIPRRGVISVRVGERT